MRGLTLLARTRSYWVYGCRMPASERAILSVLGTGMKENQGGCIVHATKPRKPLEVRRLSEGQTVKCRLSTYRGLRAKSKRDKTNQKPVGEIWNKPNARKLSPNYLIR